jgi:hypothetical protein
LPLPHATAASLRRQAERAIARAEAGRSKLPRAALELEGYSSPTVRHFLNNLCSFPRANYLEVGTWKGSTLVAASYENPGRFTAIDDFSHFVVARDERREARDQFRQARAQFRRQCRFTFHDSDCWRPSLLRRLPPDVNVYFYDGPHGSADHYRAFVHFDPVLAPRFLAVVDDWNQPRIRKATRAALADLGYRTAWEREFFTKSWFREFLTGAWGGPHWFNGLLVAVLAKPARAAPRKRTRSGARVG